MSKRLFFNKRIHMCGAFVAMLCLGLASGYNVALGAQSPSILPSWKFDTTGQLRGWTPAPGRRGIVFGGALWLPIDPIDATEATMVTPQFQIYGNGKNALLLSPDRLGITLSPQRHLKLQLKLLNRSPSTDLIVTWRAQDGEWPKVDPLKPPLQARCPMASDSGAWQTIICHIEDVPGTRIDAIRLTLPSAIRGDIWIAQIAFMDGPPKPPSRRPDIISAERVPEISVPGIDQPGFADAFKVLDEAMVVDVPFGGFPTPVISPGGFYAPHGWWEIDSSLAVQGAQWASQPFAEDVMRGFAAIQAQNPDGRIDLWAGSVIRGQAGDASSYPALFEVAYDVARRTSDVALREQVYQLMRRYLDWWLSPVKRHPGSGLISAVHEETFGDGAMVAGSTQTPTQSVAPVDLNVAIVAGATFTSRLGRSLGHIADADHYSAEAKKLTHAINTLMWDEADGVYYNRDLIQGSLHKRPLVTIFDPLRLGIAPPERRERLYRRLIDPAQFNWGSVPLTSLSKLSPDYVEARGIYDGRAWLGNVWTIRNMTVLRGLEEAGRDDLAGELAWATIKAFHRNYHEFLAPSDGVGQSVERYSWSAAQYIDALIGHLFGIDYDAIARELRFTPRVPPALYGKPLRIAGLTVPGTKAKLTLDLLQRDASHGTVAVVLDGPPADATLVVRLGGAERRISWRNRWTAHFP